LTLFLKVGAALSSIGTESHAAGPAYDAADARWRLDMVDIHQRAYGTTFNVLLLDTENNMSRRYK